MAATAASSNNTSSSREGRRRRIVERGADRLALITGRIRTLPTESQPSISDSAPLLQPSDLSSTFESSQSVNKVSASLHSNHDTVSETGQSNTRVGLFMHKSETNIEESEAPALDLGSKDQLSQVSSSFQNPSPSVPGAEHHFQPEIRHFKFCTPSEVSSAVTASETTRIYCTVAAAIVVVLSYFGFPILGSKMLKSIVFFRPLYLLLLTNISIIAAQFLSQKQRGSERTKQQTSSSPSNGEFGLVNQLGDALEIALVLQKVLAALFMDCTIYCVVVICGLSMEKTLGW